MKQTIRAGVVLAVITLIGCFPCNCERIPAYINIEGFDLEVKRILNRYNDGSFSSYPIGPEDPIDHADLLLEFTSVGSFYSFNNCMNVGRSFINSAYACSCPEPGFSGSAQRLADIVVTSNNPFFESGSASDTLSHVFNISGFTKSAFLRPTLMQPYVGDHPHAMRIMQLSLNEAPLPGSSHMFTVTCTFTDGEQFTLTTPNILFN